MTEEEIAKLKAEAAASKAALEKLQRDRLAEAERLKAAETKAAEADAKIAEMAKKLEGLDLDEVAVLRREKAEMLAREKAAEEDRMKKAGEFDQVLLNREAELAEGYTAKEKAMAAEKEALATDLAAAKQATAELIAKHRNARIESTIVAAAAKGEAIDPEDILLRVSRETAVIEIDGKEIVVIIGPDGNPTRGTDGVLLTVEKRVEAMRQNERTAHLFNGGMSGAGSQRSDARGKGPVKNPWLPEHTNLDERTRIVKEDPALAKKYREEAGLA